MRIVYFTKQTPETVNGVLSVISQLGHETPLVVTTPGTRLRPTTAYRDIIAQLPAGQDAIVTSHMRELAGILSGVPHDLVFVTGFSWLLPPELLRLPRLGALNLHRALLPAYRGPDPIFWCLANGETRTGVTFHRMSPAFDTGPIILQAPMEIASDDDAESLALTMSQLTIARLPEALEAILSDVAGAEQPQEERDDYARLVTEHDCWLDWTWSAEKLRNRVRACGREGALADLNGQTVRVRRARIVAEVEGPMESGIASNENYTGVFVRAGDGRMLSLEHTPLS